MSTPTAVYFLKSDASKLLDHRVNTLKMDASTLDRFISWCIKSCASNGSSNSSQEYFLVDYDAWKAGLVKIGAITEQERAQTMVASSQIQFQSLDHQQVAKIWPREMALLTTEMWHFKIKVEELALGKWTVPLCELIDQFGREMNRDRTVFLTATEESQFWNARKLEYVYGIGGALQLLEEEPDEVVKASNVWPFKQKPSNSLFANKAVVVGGSSHTESPGPLGINDGE